VIDLVDVFLWHGLWTTGRHVMPLDDQRAEVVTVIRLVPLSRADGTSDQAAIVASFASACVRTEGDAVFLVVRNEFTLGRLKVGDIVHWIAEPFGVIWRAEQAADAPGTPSTTSVERSLTSDLGGEIPANPSE